MTQSDDFLVSKSFAPGYNNQIVCDSFINTNKINLETQAAFTSSKSIMETQEQYVENEQS